MKTKTKARAAAKKQPKEAEAVSAPKVADYERKRTELEVAKLKVAPWNPRPKITPESVADLAASIKSLGLIQPVVAMMDADGTATLIAGHRRLVAANTGFTASDAEADNVYQEYLAEVYKESGDE